jgi:dipeptidyl aminopeptidase/acylaminoacyl peptidase
MLFFHGGKDELVPITSPQAMVTKLVETGVTAEMHEVPNAGHLEAIINREALGKVLSFTNGHLKVANHGK